MSRIKKLVRAWLKDSDKPVRFTDGTVYKRSSTGSATRVSPLRPWRGKSQRRQMIAIRRQFRAARGGAFNYNRSFLHHYDLYHDQVIAALAKERKEREVAA